MNDTMTVSDMSDVVRQATRELAALRSANRRLIDAAKLAADALVNVAGGDYHANWRDDEAREAWIALRAAIAVAEARFAP